MSHRVPSAARIIPGVVLISRCGNFQNSLRERAQKSNEAGTQKMLQQKPRAVNTGKYSTLYNNTCAL